MVMTSVIYDDMLITGRSLDGKMSFRFTAKNTEYSTISDEKPKDLLKYVKLTIYEILDGSIQDLTNDEEIWADVREKIMVENAELPRASFQANVEINTKSLKVMTKLIYEKVTENLIHQKFLSEFQDFETPYNKYEFDVQAHYHFPLKNQEEKISYQLELTIDGQTTIWK